MFEVMVSIMLWSVAGFALFGVITLFLCLVGQFEAARIALIPLCIFAIVASWPIILICLVLVGLGRLARYLNRP